eukprot:Pompholyxophrys_sp_v1_NODE_4_length_15125_cov_6.573656.p8 type:complete len:214 gc:universal NODE_4_length_15125_cov_6.573656:1880-1239(-)
MTSIQKNGDIRTNRIYDESTNFTGSITLNDNNKISMCSYLGPNETCITLDPSTNTVSLNPGSTFDLTGVSVIGSSISDNIIASSAYLHGSSSNSTAFGIGTSLTPTGVILSIQNTGELDIQSTNPLTTAIKLNNTKNTIELNKIAGTSNSSLENTYTETESHDLSKLPPAIEFGVKGIVLRITVVCHDATHCAVVIQKKTSTSWESIATIAEI